ncbi:unnamed protein product [Paramecium primaurelia]|uniref:Uncharacterized protein n=1 Tax=Paramecium primaurelia TaxID=5886 RepID=A0A8S1MWN0_PARPR|nr:unnamed protein product [Paramecium primaurelia]
MMLSMIYKKKLNELLVQEIKSNFSNNHQKNIYRKVFRQFLNLCIRIYQKRMSNLRLQEFLIYKECSIRNKNCKKAYAFENVINSIENPDKKIHYDLKFNKRKGS